MVMLKGGTQARGPLHVLGSFFTVTLRGAGCCHHGLPLGTCALLLSAIPRLCPLVGLAHHHVPVESGRTAIAWQRVLPGFCRKDA